MPEALVPISSPSTTLPYELFSSTPYCALAEMTLPEMVTPAEDSTTTPDRLPAGALPAVAAPMQRPGLMRPGGVMPMKSPVMTSPVPPDQDAVAAERLDRQALDGDVGGLDGQPVGRAAGARAVEDDHRIAEIAGLAGAVDGDRIGDRRQGRLEADGLEVVAGDGEVIVFGPEVWLDCVIAARRLPVPLSAVLLTVKVPSICRPSSDSTEKPRRRSSLRRATRSSRRLGTRTSTSRVFLIGLCGRRTGSPDHAGRAPRRARRWIASSRDRALERGRGRRGPRTDLASISTSPSAGGDGHLIGGSRGVFRSSQRPDERPESMNASESQGQYPAWAASPTRLPGSSRDASQA